MGVFFKRPIEPSEERNGRERFHSSPKDPFDQRIQTIAAAQILLGQMIGGEHLASSRQPPLKILRLVLELRKKQIERNRRKNPKN